MISERPSATDTYQSIEGKRILVTGGTTGIGRATAVLLAKAGARMMIYGRHDPELQEALSELRAISRDVYGLIADQARSEDVERVFREVDAQLGGIDVLINNAAIATHSVADTSKEDWIYTVNANLIGYMNCCHEAIPRMKTNGGGHIVNVGSMSAKLMEPSSDIYVATKTGIHGFSDSLSKHLAKDNITVSLIEPGLVESELSPKPRQEVREKQEKGEMLRPDDIARCVQYVLTQPKRCTVALVHIRPLNQAV
jgi:NADP-dependent 3-hydroxy acid dehydrogenase YdfG